MLNVLISIINGARSNGLSTGRMESIDALLYVDISELK